MTDTFYPSDFLREDQWEDFRSIMSKCMKSDYRFITEYQVIVDIPDWDYESQNRLDDIIDSCKE